MRQCILRLGISLLLSPVLSLDLKAEGDKRPISLEESLQSSGIDPANLPLCQWGEANTCQEKGAGGHPATIFSTQDGYCAKKIRSVANIKEILFYRSIANICQMRTEELAGLCEFIPRFGGVCRQDGQVFCKMENLKKLPTGSSKQTEFMKRPWALDLKIGMHTSSMVSMRQSQLSMASMTFWQIIHFVQDHYLSSSFSKGYRFAGLSRSGKPTKEYGQGRIKKVAYAFRPELTINKFLEGKRQVALQRCFAHKLSHLNASIQDDVFTRFHLVGASLLFIYDHAEAIPHENSCQLYLIDFANSLFVSKEKVVEPLWQRRNHEYVEGFRQGVRQLLHDFSMQLH